MNCCRTVFTLLIAFVAPLVGGCGSTAGTVNGVANVAAGSVADPVARLDFGISLEELAEIERAAVVTGTHNRSIGLLHHFTVRSRDELGSSTVLSVGGTIYRRGHQFVFVDGVLARILPATPEARYEAMRPLDWAMNENPRVMAHEIAGVTRPRADANADLSIEELRTLWSADLASQQNIARHMEPGILPLAALIPTILSLDKLIKYEQQDRRFLERIRSETGLHVQLESSVTEAARLLGAPLESATTSTGVRVDLFGPEAGTDLMVGEWRSIAPWVVVESIDDAVTAVYTFWDRERPASAVVFGR